MDTRIPAEILQHIFKNLEGKEILLCQRVCRRWEQVINGISDAFWKEICTREHKDVYEEAYRKSDMSWRQVYDSLNLWSEASTSKINILQIPVAESYKFQTLQNGIIACPQQCIELNLLRNKYDSIVYYDSTIHEEIHRENFEYTFSGYAENDKIIVLQQVEEDEDDEGNDILMRVIAKANRTSVFETKITQCIVQDNKVYFKRCYDDRFKEELCSIELVEENNDVTFKLDYVLLCRFCVDFILDITQIGDTQANILTDDNDIYSAIDYQPKLISSLDRNSDKLSLLKRHGFNWSSPNILNYALKEFRELLNIGSAYSYGKIVIIGTDLLPKMIHVYYNPFGSNGELDLVNAKPEISINLDYFEIEDSNCTLIEQIDVIETVRGHKIIVLYCRRMFVIELSHDDKIEANVSKAVVKGSVK